MHKKFILSCGYLLLAYSALFSGFAFPPPSAHAIPKIECVTFLPGCKTWNIGFTGDYKKNVIFKELIPKALKWMFRVAAGLAVLMGVVSGIMFVVGGGNEQLRGKAAKTAVFALLGLLLSMFAYFIVSLVERLPFPGT